MKRTIYLKKVALTLAILVLGQAICPSIALALTSGPAQPEFQGFQQVGTSNMVDLFTGDFNYNIPLCEIGGYPINLIYNSNPGMDNESSWVGLGWTLQPGAINRQMRGIPDDFKGDAITKSYHIAPEKTVGLTVGLGTEIFGRKARLGLKKGLVYNSRRGFEAKFSTKFTPAIDIGKTNTRLTAGLGLDFQPSTGLNISPSIGLETYIGENIDQQHSIAGGLNSRNGLRNFTYRVSANTDIGPLNSEITLPFGNFSYTPTSLLPLNNNSVLFHGTIGLAGIGAITGLEVDGYYTEQKLAYNTEQQSAFGYLHLAEGARNRQTLLDYNSELSGQFKENTPHIPIAYGTNDIFSISGHGTGGQFSIMRNDLGVFRPKQLLNTSISGSLGLELGKGFYAHAGTNVSVTTSDTKKSRWAARENLMSGHLQFTENNEVYEAVYPKAQQEVTPFNNDELYKEIGGTDPVKVESRRRGASIFAGNKFLKQAQENGKSVPLNLTGTVQNEERVKRNQSISYLTFRDKKRVGLNKDIQSYNAICGDCPFNIIHSKYSSSDNITTEHFTNSKDSYDHHIAEMQVTNPDGGRYVYGLPVYNKLQKEVTFSVDEDNLFDENNSSATNDIDDPFFGLIKYEHTKENSINNKKGTEQYFDATEIPPYAHSYLLTGVLSHDYVDRTGDGITDDDLGDAVKFNYTRHHEDYPWRIPANPMKNNPDQIRSAVANYHQGLLATTDDDKASYLYGKKETWYAYSIESRTMVARFYTLDRKDGLGINENGEKETSYKLRQLDKISIFSKADLVKNKDKAIPIKNVHFKYNYELCKNVPNHMEEGAGKLTLERVFFTYGNNKSGELNAYHFSYNVKDYSYHQGYYHRWGGYQKNPNGYPSNRDYPYVLQNGNEAASAWNLNEITLPSGGKINITYESDDYAYVQNKRAGQMMEVIGFTDRATNDPSLQLYSKNSMGDLSNNKFVTVQLPKPVDNLEEAERRYLEDIDQIYFSCLVRLRNNYDVAERVTGWFSLDPGRSPELIGDDLLLLPVQYLQDSKNNSVHPITYAALQKMRLELPEFVYPGFKGKNIGGAFIESMAGMVKEVNNFFKGFEKNAMNKGWGKFIITEDKSSWIRLCNPTFNKLGGGSRVAQLTISDEWVAGGGSSTYGQMYTYEKEILFNGEKTMISSGVAAYEPGIGGEENMLKTPLPYEEKFLLAPKNLYYSETPIGETLFPAPVVGYSEVRVKDIANYKINRNESGYSTHQFYTAKDFPTIVRKTDVLSTRSKSNPIFRFLKLNARDELAASQGFTIERNDMHGKPRKQSIYDKNKALLSSTEYKYLTDAKDPKKLSNKVIVILPTGETTSALVGMSMETWTEMQEERNTTTTQGLSGQIDVIPLPLFAIPGPVPNVFPIAQREETAFKSAVTTKCVQRNGILSEVIVTENGSSVTTKNEYFDSETGEVLLTKTINEFNDFMYDFNYPAYWGYERMGQAYKNIGATFSNLSIASGFLPSEVANHFQEGDEVMVQMTAMENNSLDNERYYVYAFKGKKYLLSENGNFLQANEVHRVTIFRSGFRNQLNASIGQLTSRSSPIGVLGDTLSTSTKILNATATTYKEGGQAQCETTSNQSAVLFPQTPCLHPYTDGLLGAWRPEKNLVFHSKRTGTKQYDTGVRIQDTGYGETFFPYWVYDDGQGKWVNTELKNIPEWVTSDSVSLYDIKGNALETIDALGIPSAAYFGYNKRLVTAVANNATYPSIAYDGFEDYDYHPNCLDEDDQSVLFRRQLDFLKKDHNTIEQHKAHTGKYSLQFDPGENATYTLNIGENCISTLSREEARFDMESDLCRNPYKDCKSCLPVLTPQKGEEYALSIWVATDHSLDCGEAPAGAFIWATFTGPGNDTILTPSGPVIEGWQQIEGKVKIPTLNNIKMQLLLANNNESDTMYFDDFRFHPWLSNMQSFVYDPYSERLMATLDENNYASFYEYNDEGLLVRTKRETEKGIVTIQEGRTILKSNNEIEIE